MKFWEKKLWPLVKWIIDIPFFRANKSTFGGNTIIIPPPTTTLISMIHGGVTPTGGDLDLGSITTTIATVNLFKSWSPAGKARGTYFTPQWGDIPPLTGRIHPRPKAVPFCRRGQ